MKKLISVLMLLTLLLSLGTAAMAADETGTITINGVHTGNQYDIYKLLDLESYDVTSGAYSYKVNTNWSGFFATADALKYVALDEAGYVTWINGEDDASVAAFAQLALAYAKANDIAVVDSIINDGSVASVIFEDLTLGYYLVDSTVGALCGLTTTNPNASINAKNGIPTIDKQVMEDSTGIYGDSSTADIGQTVYYQTVINVAAGAQNFVYHDKMSDTLTFGSVTKIELVTPGTSTNSLLIENTDYTVDTTHMGCTFEIAFSDDLCAGLDANDKLIIHYTAMLNRNAVIAGEGNPNDAWLTYGENKHNTTHDSTKTYTFAIDIVKTDSQNSLIDGAQFKIYDAAAGGNEIAVVPLLDDEAVPVLDENGNPMYRRARADETGVAIEVKDGIVTIIGFDNGTYYLEETVAPAGYNKLTARQKFIIADGNLEAVFNSGVYSTGSGVHVVNKTGSMLPETGGVGTTIFYTLGGVLVLGAIVLLVTKKRMKSES